MISLDKKMIRFYKLFLLTQEEREHALLSDTLQKMTWLEFSLRELQRLLLTFVMLISTRMVTCRHLASLKRNTLTKKLSPTLLPKRHIEPFLLLIQILLFKNMKTLWSKTTTSKLRKIEKSLKVH